jgi:hypothetical protein
MKAKIAGAAAFLFLVVIVTACARVHNDAQDEYYKGHGTIWKIFHPTVIAGRPLWQKSLYWIGPGHCPFCRPVLNTTTGFDNWASPYYEASTTSESITARQK